MEIIKKYEFEPDYTNIVKAARNIPAPRLPLYEHNIDGGCMTAILGVNPYQMIWSGDDDTIREGCRLYWSFWKMMGYDTASFELCTTGAFYGGGSLGAHAPATITDRDDFEKYPWDEIPDRYFELYGKIYKIFAEVCPPGMKAIGGPGNGIFEQTEDLVGYMDLCLLKSDDEELYADIFHKISDVQTEIWRRFMDAEYNEVYCLPRFGDDLGFDTSTLISADDIKEFVIPHYRRITDLVHAHGKPFLLHSCGNLFRVFDDIIKDGGIDAKHSNEDKIGHFSVWVEKYGDKIGNFGGIDTDVLCRFDHDYIRDYVLDSISRVNGHGGIAFGSGNSIPDYVPVDGYLAMVETVREWRGDRRI